MDDTHTSIGSRRHQVLGPMEHEFGSPAQEGAEHDGSSMLQIDGTDDSATADEDYLTSSRTSPSLMIKVNSSLILAQVIFGLGSVVAALGLPACNPFAFALYREVTAGFILLVAAMIPRSYLCKKNDNNRNSSSSTNDTIEGTLVSDGPLLVLTALRRSLPRFLLLGLMIFGNQAGSIAGVKLAGPIVAAIWQPSQPIMTAAICMALRWEPINGWRVAGVALAFGGCVLMVLLHEHQPEDTGRADASPLSFLVGNILFFINCLGTSLYVILSKKLLRLYAPLVVTAWSYNIAALYMALTAVLASTSTSLMSFLCPDCTSTWNIPSGALFALWYFILFNSVTAYAIMTWANKYATGTLVMGFTVLQPVTAALLTVLLLGLGTVPRCSATKNDEGACLDPPGWGTSVGMIGVFAGLALVIATEPKGTRDEYGQVAREDEIQTD